MKRPTETLPDPWLFDSEALLRELDRCRETVLQIPITNPTATHFGIQLAVNAIWNLTENLRYLLHLHREGQRSIRRQHEESFSAALAENAGPHKSNIVRINTSAPSMNMPDLGPVIEQVHESLTSAKTALSGVRPNPGADETLGETYSAIEGEIATLNLYVNDLLGLLETKSHQQVAD